MRRVLLIGFALVGLGGAAACTPVKPPTPEPETIEVPFAFTGAPVDWDVPVGVDEITVEAFGAAGGRGAGRAEFAQSIQPAVDGSGGNGGRGGSASAVLPVTPGETLQVNVGGQGDDASPITGDASGGFNGGGDAARRSCGPVDLIEVVASTGGGGGGATDVRRGSNHLIIAGGGGGGAGPYSLVFTGDPERLSITDGGDGGGGGGAAGDGGTGAFNGTGGSVVGGSAGTIDAGPGVLGVGGNAWGASTCADAADDTGGARSGGGGGGGWWGGGGGSSDFVPDPPNHDDVGGGGGGGGSGFGPNSTEFENGVREGNGRVVISYVAP